MAQERFNVLIVDPDSHSRGTLKQAALALTIFKKIYFVAAIGEALSRAESSEEPVDVVIISRRFAGEETASFIAEAKKTKRGAEWAFIGVFKGGENTSEAIASSVVMGIDGFLFEPYSADNLREIAEIVSKVRGRNETKRRRTAAELLLREVTNHLDALAFCRSQGRDGSTPQRKLTEAVQKLRELVGGDREMYFSAVSDVFEQVLPNPANYRGASKRVRERMKARMMKRIDERYK